MKVFKSTASMQKWAISHKGKSRLGFVPTMGYLHDGHLSLVKEAKKRAEKVIVSIFVNPLQFGPNEDLATYPHDLKADKSKLEALGVDALFLPTPEMMYSKDFQTNVSLSQLSQGLCGGKRPGHFDGVATVVLKLFQITQPDIAVFGRKDYQQLALITQMVKDLNLPLKIVGAPIVREKDGLAMSSRNAYLNPQERQLATGLNRGLKAIRKQFLEKPMTVARARKLFEKQLGPDRRIKIDYFEVVDATNLRSISKLQKGQSLIAVAVFVGKTRLIDNLRI